MPKRAPALTRDEKADLNYAVQERFPLRYAQDDEQAPDWRRIRPIFGFADWREEFLQEYALHGKLTHVCLQLGLKVTRVQAYIRRCKDDGIDDEFLECLEIAKTFAKEHLEISMLQRAHGGDTFAGIFLLKAMDPATYVHPMQVNQKIEKNQRIEIDIRATGLDYREAIAALAPGIIEGEATELPSSDPTDE